MDLISYNLNKKVYSFLQNFIFHEYKVLEYTDKNYATKGGGVRQMLTGLTKGGREGCGIDDNG